MADRFRSDAHNGIVTTAHFIDTEHAFIEVAEIKEDKKMPFNHAWAMKHIVYCIFNILQLADNQCATVNFEKET